MGKIFQVLRLKIGERQRASESFPNCFTHLKIIILTLSKTSYEGGVSIAKRKSLFMSLQKKKPCWSNMPLYVAIC